MMFDLQALTSTAGMIWEGLWHATALALVTGLLSVTLMRQASPGWKALIWTAVLVKFLLPPRLLPGIFSFSQWLASAASTGVPGSNAGTAGGPAIIALATEASPAADAAHPWWLPVVTLLYLTGVVLCAGRWARHAWQMRRALAQLPVAPSWLTNEVMHLAQLSGLWSKRLQIRVAPNRASPYLVGLFRRILVVPEAFISGLHPPARQALILHELAHLRRADLHVRWLQNLVRTLFFFWPPVWWVCRRIERFSEMACDQWAVAVSRVSGRQYAESVLEIARNMSEPSPRQFDLALVGRGRFLEERFEMILNRKAATPAKWYWIPLLALWVPFALAGTGTLSTPQEQQIEKRVEIRKQGDQDPNQQLPAEVLDAIPGADLNGDGILTLGELKQHLNIDDSDGIFIKRVKKTDDDGNELPVEVTVKVVSPGEEGDWHHAEEELHEHGNELNKEVEVFVTAEDSGEHEVVVQLDAKGDLSSILKRHPEADLNQDGELTKEELSQWMEENHNDMPMKIRVRRMGGDNDAVLSSDFMVWRGDGGEDFVIETDGRAVHQVRIEDLDQDGDGNISKQEIEAYRQVCCPESEGEANIFIAVEPETHVIRVGGDEIDSKDRLKRLLEKYPDADLDQDGTLSKEEAKALATRLQKKKPSQ